MKLRERVIERRPRARIVTSTNVNKRSPSYDFIELEKDHHDRISRKI